MHKIDGQYNVGGEFVDGNPGAGINATRLNAKWFNTIQRELCNIVERAGMALSENDDGQVLNGVIEYIRKYGIQGILGSISGIGEHRETYDISTKLIRFLCAFVFEVHEGYLRYANGNGVTLHVGNDGLSFEIDGYKFVVDSEGVSYGAEGTETKTVIGIGNVETNQVIGSSGKFGKFLDVGSSLNVNDKECRVRVKTIVQNDMGVSGDLEVQGFINAASGSFIRARSESFIRLPFVDASTEAELKDPSTIIRSQILDANPLEGDIVMVRNKCGHPVEFRYSSAPSSDIGVVVVAVGESIFYAYDGSYWSKVW
jgi:hypothetical protein